MKRAGLTALACLAALAAAGSGAAPVGSRAATPEATAGEIRIWGSPQDRGLLSALEAGYRAGHPEVRFGYQLHGPESTLAGVYTGVADLAFMSRELREPLERMAFEWALLSKPCQIEFAHAGFDPAAPGGQLGVFVNAANPLDTMSLKQLDAILGTERRRGGALIDDWSALEVHAAGRGAIRVYGPELDSIAALFVRRKVMLDSRKWNPDYREYASREQALAALAGDPAGIAIAALGAVRAGVKLLALSRDDGGVAVLPTAASVRDGSYPLTRTLTVVVHRPAGQPLGTRLESYLRFLVSPEGQSVIGREGRDLPLSESAARRQLARLD
jgi:phosphate transport system substrate-binding protein